MDHLSSDDNCTHQDLYESASSLHSVCRNISIARLQFLQDASVVYVVIGLLSALSSFLTIYVIYFDYQLRTKTYYFIANLGIVDLIASCGLIYIGSKRLLFYFLGKSDVMSQSACLYQETPLVIGFTGNLFTLFLTAIDRLLAIVLPAWYQNGYPNWLYVGQYACIFVYVAFEVGSLYLGVINHDRVISICAYTLSSSRNALFEQSIRAKVIVGATVLLYTFHMFRVKSKVRRARSAGSDRARMAKRELQVRVLITLICIVASFVCTTIAAQVLYSIALSARMTDVEWGLKMSTYAASLMSTNSCCGFAIMYCRSRDFRAAVRRLVLRKEASVPAALMLSSPRSSGVTSIM